MSDADDVEAARSISGEDASRQCRSWRNHMRTKCTRLGHFFPGITAVLGLLGPVLQKEPIAVLSVLVGGPTTYYTYVQATESYKAGDDSKISEAVQNFLRPYQPPDPTERVIPRAVMNTTKGIITAWSSQTKKATIVSGRYSAGKTVAVNEALRGVRGALQVSVRDASWEEKMYKELGIGDYGMFKQVLRRVAVELQKMPDNPTSYPILLLEVPRQAPAGAGESMMATVSNMAKDLAVDAVGNAPTHVIVSCSSAAFALAFDAGGSARQQDVWVGGFTKDEAEKLAMLNGCGKDDWTKIQPIVEKCDYRAGDVVDVCAMIKSGMPSEDIKAKLERRALDDVVGFKSLTVDGANVGQQMLHELGQSPTGMTKTVKSVRYDPREIAAEIRKKNAHAVLWNPEEERYFFASEMHREAAETLLGHP